MSRLQGLVTSSVNLGTEVGSSGTRSGEIASEDWLDERTEDDLSSASGWESEPENEDELERVVEWEPVNGADQALKDSQESEDNPVSEPLGIITLSDTEESLERIIPRDYETSDIGKELTTDVEEDEKEVGRDQTEECVDLGDRSLLLEVVQDRVLGKLSVDLSDMGLRLILERHFDWNIVEFFENVDGAICY